MKFHVTAVCVHAHVITNLINKMCGFEREIMDENHLLFNQVSLCWC
jgi:hypothetical protein